MSDRTVVRGRQLLFRRGIASLILVASFSIIFLPEAAFAEEAPVQSGQTQIVKPSSEAPAVIVTPTATCSAQSTSSQAKLVQPASWSTLQVTGSPRTNDPSLVWQWSKPSSQNPVASFSGYGYALYIGETLLQSGELSPDTVQFTYGAADDGIYRLLVWVIDTTTGEPTATNCESNDTQLDRVGPVINGDTYTKNGNKATPDFTTDETDVTYGWVTDADIDAVTVSNASVLVPTFTFLKDGTYAFKLFASDSLGNTTVISFSIQYLAPFVPGPSSPEVPAVELPPVNTYVPPEVALVEVKKAVLDSYNYGATAYDITSSSDVAASTVPQTDGSPATLAALTTAPPIDSSKQGWVVLGVSWYWWVLGLAAVILGIRLYRSGFLRSVANKS